MKHLSGEALLCGGFWGFFLGGEGGGGCCCCCGGFFGGCCILGLFVFNKTSQLDRRIVSESILVVSSAVILHTGLLFRSKTCCS